MFHVQMSSMQILLLSLLLSGSLIQSAEGTVQVTVKEDSDAVLPCSLSTKENIETTLFDWKKGGQEVFMYNGGDYYGQGLSGQDKQFEGRVSHFNEELKNGNASIKIRKTKVVDSGVYTCIFPRLQPRQTFNIELVVVACRKPSVTILDESSDQALLQCHVEGASPKPKVEWRDSSGNILHAEEPQVTKNEDGSYDIIRNKTVTKTDTYSCVVTQDAICHQINSRIYVHISGAQKSSAGAASKPSVTILDQSKDWSLLQCEVYVASPEATVEWRDSSGNILHPKERQVTERGGSYDIILQTTVTKSDTYSCVVTQDAIKQRAEADTYVHISGSSTGWIVAAVVAITLLVAGVVAGLIIKRRYNLVHKKGHTPVNKHEADP